MNKQKLFPLAAVLLLVTGMASAQMWQQAIKANIPFSFIAGNMSLPAGEYRVTAISDLGVLAVTGGDTGQAMVGSHAVQGKAASATKLIFHRYGDQYFLYQIWVQGEDRGRELPQTSHEKELLAKARFSSVAVLAHR